MICPAIARAKLDELSKLFSHRNFIQTCFKKYDSQMVKKTKFFALPKSGSLPQKIGQVFETGGRTYFALLIDRFITYTNKIGSSATRA